MSAVDDLADELGIDTQTAHEVLAELLWERQDESTTVVREGHTSRVVDPLGDER